MKTIFKSYIFEINEDKEILDERWDLIGWIILGLIFLFVIIEWLWMALLALFIILATTILITIKRWGVIEPLNGNFTKDLVITENEIIVGGSSYKISELRIRRITTDDYHGLSTVNHKFFARYPSKSNGTFNHLWFVYKNQNFKYRFRIRGKTQLEQLEELKKNFKIKW
ncbi:MAG: hypothetical protein AB8B73_06790 [Ekhidna sp.]